MEAGRQYCAEKLQMTADIRRMVLHELDDIADLVTIPRADGAFYFLLRIHKDTNPMELVRQLIEKHKVAVIPGTTFGVEDKCYLRIAYGALQKETVSEGIDRLIEGLKQILSR